MTAKLTVLPGGAEKMVDACCDCRHSTLGTTAAHFGWEHARECGAWCVPCTNVRHALQMKPCPRFVSKYPPTVKLAPRPPRPPGLLRRLWRWLW